MEGKKISFGFKKTKKAEKSITEEKKEFIDCLEEQSIKIVGGETIQEEAPLVIPMKPNTLVTAERLKQIAEEVESAVKDLEPNQKPEEPVAAVEPCENETLDQMAARELLEDAKKEIKVKGPELTVPIPSQVPLTGQKESTLDDYEAVPIQEFGLAMLRGMGWSAGKEQSKYKEPQLRPKGLGLGADKVVKQNQTKPSGKDEEDLMIVKNACVKITSGKYNGLYGKVVSLDEDNGRVMVDMAVRRETVSLSEFMMQPVTKAEFDKQSRVINAEKYEEYKQKEITSQKSRNDSPKTGSTRSERRDGTSRNDRENVGKQEPREKSERDRDSRQERDRDNRQEYDRGSRQERDRDRREQDRDNRQREDGDRREHDRDNRQERDRDRREQDRDNRDRRVGSSRQDNREARESKYDNEKSSNGKSKEERHRKRDSSPEKKRYSSNESVSSLSDSEKRRKHKEQRRKSTDSDSSDSTPPRHKKSKKHTKRDSTPEGKRDIDKKRKGKKKKRDRDRSPNYKKHRK